MSKQTLNIDELRLEWTDLYSKTLPSLARANNPAQEKWPVTLDHCFARIVLDNTVGQRDNEDIVPWDTVIRKPAIRNMTEAQLQDAIAMGEMVRSGEVNLVELDKRSLKARGKNEKKYDKTPRNNKRIQADDRKEENSPAKRKRTQATLPFVISPKQQSKHFPIPLSSESVADSKAVDRNEDIPAHFEKTLRRIYSHESLTPYRKRLYATLLTVPRGEYTTYQAMADFLNSSARAVGNGMRHNPFAPDVPCHRVLASDRSLGGFMGDWGKDGRYADKKVKLLKEEGIKFDSNGKVRGPVFRAFQKLDEPEAIKAN